MLVSLSKNSPATNSHTPVATMATTNTNRTAVRISVQRGVLEIDAGERPPGGRHQEGCELFGVNHDRPDAQVLPGGGRFVRRPGHRSAVSLYEGN
jgi:hypothetical protein